MEQLAASQRIEIQIAADAARDHQQRRQQEQSTEIAAAAIRSHAAEAKRFHAALFRETDARAMGLD